MSSIYEKLKSLANKRRISLRVLTQEIGISYGTVKKWTNREPSYAHRMQVGKYLEIQELRSSTYNIATQKEPDQENELKTVNTSFVEITPDECMLSLKTIYERHNHGTENWEKESPTLARIIHEIYEQIKKDYALVEPLQHGGVSVILKVLNRRLNVRRALKFPRPIDGYHELFTSIISDEIKYLVEAIHRNIVEVYDYDTVTVDGSEYPYYIMKYIDGAKDAEEFFSDANRTSEQLIHILQQIIAAIRHLHSLNIVHLDIKPENILIAPDEFAVLSDLGSARKLTGNPDDNVLAVYTRGYAHPQLIEKKIASTTDPNRMRGYLKRGELQKKYDLYALGKTIISLLQYFDPNIVTRRIPAYHRKYLHLLACRALDGKNADEQKERAMALPRSAFEELKYESIEQIEEDFKKLTGEFPLSTYIPEIDQYCTTTIQIGGQWKAPLSGRLEKLINHRSLQRLTGVSQLGLLVQVYPTATHTRFEHSLGVFTNAIHYIQALYNDPVNPLFRQIMTPSDIAACLLASLFHDIGHFPLAHDLSEAAPEVFSHERIAVDILNSTSDLFYGNLLREIIIRDWQVSPQYIAQILISNPNNTDLPIKPRLLHTIIEGPIDADKLDYLTRDARTLGLPYASGFDLQRLLNCLTVIYQEKDRRLYVAVGIHEKGRISAESIAFARYAMFGTVYWHHTSRAAKAMLHRSIWEIVKHLGSSPRAEKDFRTMFYREFIESRLSQPKVLRLLPLETQEGLDPLTQVLPADREILGWIKEKTSTEGKELITYLNERNIFKRVLVISERRNGRLWDMLIRFRKASTILDMIRLQEEIQRRIMDSIRAMNDTERRKDTILTTDNIDMMIARQEQGKIWALIDIPIDRPGTTTALEYMPEDKKRDMSTEWRDDFKLEDSIIWRELHEKFLQAVGKVRLFCHSECAEVVAAALDRDRLEDIIETSIRTLR